MNDKKLWIAGGLLFFVAAIATLFGENKSLAIAFVVIGVLFLTMPAYLDRKNRKGRSDL
jgi:hypothetical protein